jgi:TRAP-type C4-dicarboxylate transport system substrate-binding protein
VKLQLKSVILAAGAAAMIGAMAPSAKAEKTVTMVYPFPDFLIYTKSCKAMVVAINKAGAGVLKIDLKPYNSIKMFQQPGAVSKGVVDMVCTPAAFYARALPENEAVATSNSSPAAVRGNGGMKILDDLHQKHLNMKYLGWIDSGPNFRIYMKNPPKFGSNGMPDFTGVKMRDNPIYGAFLRAMKATTHSMSSSQVYSALEKGVVNASAWATLGLPGLKWDKFLRHAVEPDFYQTDIGIAMNLKTWKGLGAKAQNILQSTVIAWENSSRAARTSEAAAERKKLIAEGMKFYTAPAGEKYTKLAVNSAYARMEGRLGKMGRTLEWAKKLRQAYQK